MRKKANNIKSFLMLLAKYYVMIGGVRDLISALARQDPKKALDYMNALIFTAELRHEILVDAAKSIAGRGKSREIDEVRRIIAFAANEPASLQKVKLYLTLAEAFKNIEPLQSN